ncbi:MAG: CBS domain-containing protein [Planctomycetota bacterium]|nr:MAG: CBS domain-containing protein [Planctomycetota bacterium]
MPWFGHISPGAYALVGMAAVVASSIHAPLTATLMLFELTRDYKVIVPIMLAAVAGLSIARWIETASIYTLKLRRRGVRLGSEALRALQRVAVRDLRRIRAPIVSPSDPVDSLVRIMRTTTANDFLVVDDKGRLVGMVLGDDLRTMLLESDAMPLLTVSDVVREDVPVVHLDETLDIVMDRFQGKPVHSLPVIDSQESQVLGELVTRAEVMNRYNQLLAASGA